MNNDLMFSSKTCEWATPQSFFNKLTEVFNFEIDLCASKQNAKCNKFYTEEDNGLAQDWLGICWMNPPYGSDIGAWVKKAYESAKQNNATVVCLLPARTDTKWWHNYCKDAELYFVKGRLKFGGSKNAAPFPSAVVIFRPKLSDIFG
jgi:phage N-6-adenine-methyltransferase